MYAKLAKYCLVAAVISPVIVIPSLDLSFGKYLLFRLLVELAAALVLGEWAFGDGPGFASRGRTILRHPVAAAVLVYSAVFLSSAIFAFDPAVAFWSTYSRGEGVFQLLHYCAFLILLVLLFREARDWELLLTASIVAACVSAAYGFLWPAGVSTSVHPQDLPIPDDSGFWGRLMGHRFVASIGNSIWAGSYFVFQLGYLAWVMAGRQTIWTTFVTVAAGLFAAIACWVAIVSFLVLNTGTAILIMTSAAFAFIQVFRRFGNRTADAVLAVSATALLFFAFLLAGSRGAFLGFAAAAMLLGLIVLQRARGWRLTVSIMGGALAAAAGLVIVISRYAGPVVGRSFLDATSGEYRLRYWRTAWTGFLERPLLGWGPENYTAVHDRYADVFWATDHAHSMLFDALAGAGALGAAALFAIFAACAYVTYRAIRRPSPAHPAVRIEIIAALLAAYLVQGLFNFDWLPVTMHFYVALACLIWLTPVDAVAAVKRPATPNWRIARYLGAATALIVIAWAAYAGNYLPLVKATAFRQAVTLRLESWDECREAFDKSLRLRAPFGQDELVQQFGSSVANLLRERKTSSAEVALWETYFRGFAQPLIEQKRASMVRMLEAAADVATAAFRATGESVYFAAAEEYYRMGLSVNPVNLMLLRGQFDLYTVAGRRDDASRIARTLHAIWPAILAPDPRIEAALRAH